MFLLFYNTHTTLTCVHNPDNTTHHTTRIQHKNITQKIKHEKYKKYNTKTFFPLFFFSYAFSFLLQETNWYSSFFLSFVFLKYIQGQKQFVSLRMFSMILTPVLFFVALNCAVISCVTSISWIGNVRSLLRLTLG